MQFQHLTLFESAALRNSRNITPSLASMFSEHRCLVLAVLVGLGKQVLDANLLVPITQLLHLNCPSSFLASQLPGCVDVQALFLFEWHRQLLGVQVSIFAGF